MAEAGARMVRIVSSFMVVGWMDGWMMKSIFMGEDEGRYRLI